MSKGNKSPWASSLRSWSSEYIDGSKVEEYEGMGYRCVRRSGYNLDSECYIAIREIDGADSTL